MAFTQRDVLTIKRTGHSHWGVTMTLTKQREFSHFSLLKRITDTKTAAKMLQEIKEWQKIATSVEKKPDKSLAWTKLWTRTLKQTPKNAKVKRGVSWKTKPANMEIFKRLTTVHANYHVLQNTCLPCVVKKKKAPKGGFPTMPYNRITILDSSLNNSVNKI